MAYISEREPTCYMRTEWDIGGEKMEKRKRRKQAGQVEQIRRVLWNLITA